MNISYKCDYALKVLLHLALHEKDGTQSSQVMSKALQIPLKFLEQIMSDLKKARLINSKRGNVGGYTLAVNPNKITLGKVIRLISPPVEPIACVDDCYKGCTEMSTCAFRPIWKKIYDSTSKIIENTTIADIAEKSKKHGESFHYDI